MQTRALQWRPSRPPRPLLFAHWTQTLMSISPATAPAMDSIGITRNGPEVSLEYIAYNKFYAFVNTTIRLILLLFYVKDYKISINCV